MYACLPLSVPNTARPPRVPMPSSSAQASSRALYAVSAARVRSIVSKIEGIEDEVITDMILRHLARCASDDDADRPGLHAMLSIITDRADALADEIAPHREPVSDARASEWPFKNITLREAAALEPAALGLEVRQCADSAKGRGIFATRRLRAGELVGVYFGVRLSFESYWLRYGARGGDDEAGEYVFLLPSWSRDEVRGERVHCIDAEDEATSSWARFFNHAINANIECRVDATGGVWFEVGAAPIEKGAELAFNYGPSFSRKPWYRHLLEESLVQVSI